MTTPITVYLKDGRVLTGVSYRMHPSTPDVSTQQATFSFQGPRGWITVNMSNVNHIQAIIGNPT